MRRLPSRSLATTLLLLTCISCSDFPAEPVLTTVQVSRGDIWPDSTGSVDLQLGEVADLQIVVLDGRQRELSDVDVTWTSSDEEIVRVSGLTQPTGSSPLRRTLTAHLTGEAEVVALISGRGLADATLRVPVTVRRDSWPSSMTVSETALVELTVTNATLRGPVSWQSGNQGVLQVIEKPGNEAQLKAIAQGSAEVIVTIGGLDGLQETIRVPVSVDNLGIVPEGTPPDTLRTTQLGIFEVRFVGDVDPDLADSLRWESSNPSVAEVVQQQGLQAQILGISPGRVEIITRLEASGFEQKTLRQSVFVGQGWSTVSAGGWLSFGQTLGHTCAISTESQAYCWGSGARGQLGNGTFGIQTAVPAPTRVPTSFDFRDLQAGAFHTCGLTGQVGTTGLNVPVCWGSSGSFGVSNTSNFPNSQDVLFPRPDTTSVSAIAVGLETRCATEYRVSSSAPNGHACVGEFVAPAGFLGSGWGRPSIGSTSGGAFIGLEKVRTVALGARHSCVVQTDVWCAGANYAGQTGINSTAAHVDRFQKVGLGPVTSISSGADHTCAVGGGGVSCWGSNEFGQLGGPSSSTCDAWRSNQIQTPDPRADFDTPGGRAHVSFLYANASIPCSLSPQSVAGSWTQVSSGYGFTCALDSAGTAYCWGKNDVGQLGIGTTSVLESTPRPVAGGISFLSIDVGFEHGCGVSTDRGLYCWGANGDGRLGFGGLSGPEVTPRIVAEPRN